MNSYGTIKKCPKCGYNEFRDEWKPSLYIAGDSPRKVEERMLRKCMYCGFCVSEHPMDYIG